MKIPAFLGAAAWFLALLPAQPQETLTPQQWQSDLGFLARELPRRHKNAFAYLSRADFEKQVSELRVRIPQLSEGEIRVGIYKVVASLGDAHTSIWGDGRPDAFHFLPIQFSWFKDGLFIIGAAQPFHSLLAGRLRRIGGMSSDEACRALAPYMAHDNDSCRRVNLPVMLTMAEFLYAARVSDTVDQALVEVESPTGELVSCKVRAVARSEMPRGDPAYTGDPPVSQRNPKAAYWATLLGHDTTLYFQYNRCRDDPQKPFAAFRTELTQLMSRATVQRLVLDLRYNGGGSNRLLAPWVKEIRASRFNRKGKLFVLIGPRTFSSAVYHAVELRDRTAAALVGEPTCGKPNGYGDVRLMELPHSHIRVAYSTKYFKQRPVDEPCLMPDIVVEQTSKDFFGGIDPVLNAALR